MLKNIVESKIKSNLCMIKHETQESFYHMLTKYKIIKNTITLILLH